MGLKAGLYIGLEKVGIVKFSTLRVRRPADYSCQPPSMLTHEEVEQIARDMYRDPESARGRVAKYIWLEEE